MRTFCRLIVTAALAVTVFFSALAVSPASARAMHRHRAMHSRAHRYAVRRRGMMRHHYRTASTRRPMARMHSMTRTTARRRMGGNTRMGGNMSPGIGTHGTATTGAGQGTSTNMVPAGGTNADPLGGGTTSAGTATTGTGTSNK